MKVLTTLMELIGFGLLLVAAMYYVLPAKELPSFLPGFMATSSAKHPQEALMAFLGGIVLFAISYFIK